MERPKTPEPIMRIEEGGGGMLVQSVAGYWRDVGWSCEIIENVESGLY